MANRKTLSGIAEQYLGDAGDFTKLLDFNEAELPFDLPPMLGQVLQSNGTVKIPSQEEILKQTVPLVLKELGAEGALGRVQQGVQGVQGVIDKLKGVKGLEQATDEAERLLDSIEWLL